MLSTNDDLSMDLLDEQLTSQNRLDLIDRLTRRLRAEGFTVNRSGDQPFLAVPVQGQSGRWVVAGRAFPGGQGLVCYAILQEQAAPERRAALVQRMNALNNELLFGNFELTQSGEVRLRTSVYFGHGEVDEAMLLAAFYGNLSAMDEHLSLLQEALAGT